jgi:hypothetical protein
MDRRRRPTLLAGAAVLLLAAAAPPLAEMRWLAAEPGRDRALAERPGECLVPPADPAARQSIEVGRAAFRSPLLLGGAAARAGLSCDSCHRDGRSNPLFRFPGVSGAPGTADVTTSRFSSHRGNGVDDPVAIPDLSGPKAALKVSQDPGRPDLSRFIEGLVAEEFDGPRPSPAVLAGLAAYVRALDPAACPAKGQPRSARALLDDADRALAAGRAALAAGDAATTLTMIAAARAALGRIDERYAGLEASRAALRRADAALASGAQAVREGRPDAAARLTAWRPEGLAGTLDREAGASLFNPARLAERAP